MTPTISNKPVNIIYKLQVCVIDILRSPSSMMRWQTPPSRVFAADNSVCMTSCYLCTKDKSSILPEQVLYQLSMTHHIAPLILEVLAGQLQLSSYVKIKQRQKPATGKPVTIQLLVCNFFDYRTSLSSKFTKLSGFS